MGITLLRPRFPSPALIVACVALFAALGGGAYAATQASTSSIHFTNATLQSGWHNVGGTFAPAGYAKDSLGVVHLRGAITGGGSSTEPFRLPSGLRPSHILTLPILTTGGTLGYVEIYPSGIPVVIGTDVTTFTSLDGVSFAAGE